MSEGIIYHYTSPEGLKAILENYSLRFTNYEFLNDMTEGKSLKDDGILLNKIKNFLKEQILKTEEKNFFNKLIANLTLQDLNVPVLEKDSMGNFIIEHYKHYVFCASKDKDSLSMWNYYIKNNKYEGYNIGFKVDALYKFLENLNNNKIIKGEIKYSFQEEYKIIEDKISKFKVYLEQNIKDKNPIKYNKFLKKCRDELLEEYLFYKQKYFEHENEYRFVIRYEKKCMKEKFFLKNGLFIPYIEISCNSFKLNNIAAMSDEYKKALCNQYKKDFKKTISSITLSPLLDKKDIAKRGLEEFLIDNGYELYNEQTKTGIKIETSNCPIRY